MSTRLLTVLFVSAGLVVPLTADLGAAIAQVPTVSPGGGLSDPAKPPPRAAPKPNPIIVNVPGAKGGDGKSPATTTPAAGKGGVFHLDEYGNRRNRWQTRFRGPVPELHVVRRGDTLWDISWYYFSNPWE